MKSKSLSVAERRALAKLITLIESDAESHKAKIVGSLTKPEKECVRLAISGPPGVGKSTFINALGISILNRGFRLAVLAIDPSSEKSGGSILADKTRMTDVLPHDRAFIRPSPSRGAMGGITPYTYDTILALESFGFDFIIIETLGVGQSEARAWAISDHFAVLMQPGSGDQVQAMKKGILERAHSMLVAKADGPHQDLAYKTLAELSSMVSESVYIKAISAHQGLGVEEFLSYLLENFTSNLSSLRQTRTEKLKSYFEFVLETMIVAKLHASKDFDGRCSQSVDALVSNHTPMFLAAEAMLGDIYM